MMEIFQYEFMINAFIAGILIAILTSTLSLFVVVKRYAMLSDALATCDTHCHHPFSSSHP